MSVMEVMAMSLGDVQETFSCSLMREQVCNLNDDIEYPSDVIKGIDADLNSYIL